MVLFKRDLWARGWSVPLYMGYSRKVEGSSFPTVVVSDRAAHFMARNLNLKMGFFQTKNRRHWTTRWDNLTKISGNIDLLEVYQMVYLNFNLKNLMICFYISNQLELTATMKYSNQHTSLRGKTIKTNDERFSIFHQNLIPMKVSKL